MTICLTAARAYRLLDNPAPFAHDKPVPLANIRNGVRLLQRLAVITTPNWTSAVFRLM
jgi:hypothetical protein